MKDFYFIPDSFSEVFYWIVINIKISTNVIVQEPVTDLFNP